MFASQADELIAALQGIEKYLRVITKSSRFNALAMAGVSFDDGEAGEMYEKYCRELLQEEIS